MRKKQPVFYLFKKDVEHIFKYARDNSIIPHPSYKYVWGTLTSKEEPMNAVDSVQYDEDHMTLVSNIIDVLNRFYITEDVYKGFKPPNSNCRPNRVLDFYKQQFTFRRKVKDNAHVM